MRAKVIAGVALTTAVAIALQLRNGPRVFEAPGLVEARPSPEDVQLSVIPGKPIEMPSREELVRAHAMLEKAVREAERARKDALKAKAEAEKALRDLDKRRELLEQERRNRLWLERDADESSRLAG